jgi:hypothetical protein
MIVLPDMSMQVFQSLLMIFQQSSYFLIRYHGNSHRISIVCYQFISSTGGQDYFLTRISNRSFFA